MQICLVCNEVASMDHWTLCTNPGPCVECGYSDNAAYITIIHTTDGITMYSDNYRHWEVCSECGTQCNFCRHYDNNGDGFCDDERCRHAIVECPGHTYGIPEPYNEYWHTYECSICHKVEYVSHGSCDPNATVCAACNMPRENCTEFLNSHITDFTYVITEKSHTQTCNVCQAKISSDHSANCKNPTVCEVCGASVEKNGIVIGTINHMAMRDPSFANDYCHWGYCNDCQSEVYKSPHNDYDGDGYCDDFECGHSVSPCPGHQYQCIASYADMHTIRCQICFKEMTLEHSNCDPNATACAICGKARNECTTWIEDHVYEGINGYDVNNHWMICLNCQSVSTYCHTENCENRGVCESCGCTAAEDGIVFGEATRHYKQQFDSNYSDDYCHRMVCANCGEVIQIMPHYDYDDDGLCDLSECGHEIKECPGHQWTLTGSNAENHDYECSICHTTMGEIHGSCDPNATACAICGKDRSECTEWMTEHMMEMTWGHDSMNHWQTCRVCNEVFTDCHVANCTSPDICANCGCSIAGDGIVIDNLWHNWAELVPANADDYCHWRNCNDCSTQSFDVHFDGDGDGYCDITECGHEVKPCTGHQWMLIGTHPELHDYECSICHTTMGELHGSCDPDATECAVCGKNRSECTSWTEEHMCGTYESDAMFHWKTCRVCNEVFREEHATNCMNQDHCAICERSVSRDGIMITHVNHDGTVRKSEYADDYCHWAYCTQCGQIAWYESHYDEDGNGLCDNEDCQHLIKSCPGHQWILVASHAESHDYECSICHVGRGEFHGSCDPSATECAVCGRAKALCNVWIQEHISGGNYSHNDTEHWQICSACGNEIRRDVHNGRCTNPDTCADCGCTVAGDGIVIADVYHNESGVQPENTDDYCHWSRCYDCGKISSFDKHIDDDGDGYCDVPECAHAIGTCPGHDYVLAESDLSDDRFECRICHDTYWNTHGNCKGGDTCLVCGIHKDDAAAFNDTHNYRSFNAVNDEECSANCIFCGEPTTQRHIACCSDLTVCNVCGLQNPVNPYLIHNMGCEDGKHYCIDCGTANTFADLLDDYEHTVRCCSCGEDLGTMAHNFTQQYDDWNEYKWCEECGLLTDYTQHVSDGTYHQVGPYKHATTCINCDFGGDVLIENHYDWDADGKCDLCGVTFTPCTHPSCRYEKTYTVSGDISYCHSIYCSECGDCVCAQEPHTDTDQDGVCDICKATGIGICKHNYDSFFVNDIGFMHARFCGHCGLEIPGTQENHIDDDRDDICDLCGGAVFSAINILSTGGPEYIACEGDAVSLHVLAEGTELTYQWQYSTNKGASWSNSPATGNKTDTVNFNATVSRNGYQYRCVINNCYGVSVMTDPTTLTVVKPVSMTAQPADQTSAAGKNVKFTVGATGTELKYQWEYKTATGSWNNTGATGNKTDTLTVAVTAAKNGYQYRCVVTDIFGIEAVSDAATLTVATELKITGQPADVTAAAGANAKYTVTATGDGLKYQWQYKTPTGNWVNTTATGYNTATISIPATVSRNGYSYRCNVTDQYGNTVSSNAAVLTVKAEAELKITGQPANVTVKAGENAKFTVTATGSGLTYRWQFKTPTGAWQNTAATGYNTATVSVAMTTAKNGYSYRCVVKDASGKSVTSNEAKLTLATELKITGQPANVTAATGSTAKFTVTAAGNGLTYQWQYRTAGGSWNNTSATGCKTATVSIAVTAAKNGYGYRCIITDASGNKVTSNEAKLTVATELKITGQPTNVTVKAGETAKFTVTATGSGLTYRWQFKTPTGAWQNTAATGYNTATVSVAMTTAKNGYSYRCVVMDATGKSVTSNEAKLTLATELKITGQPANVTAATGSNAKFTVTAAGNGLTYQWQYRTAGGSWNNTSATGCKTATVSIAVTAAKNGYGYRCIITDASGNKVTSSEAKLTVATELKITAQPMSTTVAAGTNAKFSVTATGSGLTYRWQFKTPTGAWQNTSATGCTTASLTVGATAAKNGYSYRCIITDATGKNVTSGTATMTVK